VSLHGGTVVTVTTNASYPTVFLSIIGINDLQVTGRAEARTVRSVQGVER
ncbi:pilus assembly protein, partial [Escherichia coli]|nr:pilus assembly protein [Escherichia coli]